MDSTRRGFLGAAGLTIAAARLVRGTEANSAVRVGLLGCGGRGSTVAASIEKNAGARVAALGDLFQDQIDAAKKTFAHAEHLFVGPHAYEEMAASKEIDAIVIATPPYYHPLHLGAIVDAGKHVYCEKPVAVDVPGTRRVLEIGRKAGNRLSLEVGFQIRSAPPFVELVKRIHAGAIGEIGFGEAYYYCPYMAASHPNVPPAQLRIRNWLHDRVLSGDIIVEQNIHAIDICNWVLKGHPLKAVGAGGRRGRPEDGCLGNCSVSFFYPDDVRLNFSSVQFGKGPFDVSERFFGTRGSSQSPYSGVLGIDGEEKWTWSGSERKTGAEFSTTGAFTDNLAEADAEKHRSFIGSITSGQFHNQAEAGVESSLTAMLGRAAMYTGRDYTWDELLRSEEAWDAGIDLEKLG
ncbi:MAG TPA: Gfo/Idh/MocA family oxidoreductase [Bryobacteraceae bacterium]|nr:Gfo/Idh/MocA family oxidoreductase [Bryobacteraceae bacterium]